MELQLVSFKQAKNLKELGFPFSIKTHDHYAIDTDHNKIVLCTSGSNEHTLYKTYQAPSLELVAKWLREEKDIDIIILPRKRKSNSGKYVDKVYDITFKVEVPGGYILRGDSKSTYEQVLSAGIDKAIEILNNLQ